MYEFQLAHDISSLMVAGSGGHAANTWKMKAPRTAYTAVSGP